MHIEPHPLLDCRVFMTEFPRPLGELPTPEVILAFLRLDVSAPMQSSDEVRSAVRDLLRHGGFKPTGRSKPASEYLLKAAGEGTLSGINAAVDLCNLVSLHSGLPISVVDLDRTRPPLGIALAPPDSHYVFNSSGQTIDVGGLLCLYDADGPCANPVKDAQRTKTTAETIRTCSVLWSTRALPGRVEQAERWYREWLEQHFEAKTSELLMS